MLRLLWASLRWDDMGVKPSSQAGTTRTGERTGILAGYPLSFFSRVLPSVCMHHPSVVVTFLSLRVQWLHFVPLVKSLVSSVNSRLHTLHFIICLEQQVVVSTFISKLFA